MAVYPVASLLLYEPGECGISMIGWGCTDLLFVITLIATPFVYGYSSATVQTVGNEAVASGIPVAWASTDCCPAKRLCVDSGSFPFGGDFGVWLLNRQGDGHWTLIVVLACVEI